MIGIVFLGLWACKSDTTFQGTLVGNPGKGGALIADPEDVTVTAASGTASKVMYVPRNNTYSSGILLQEEMDLQLDLLNPNDFIPLQQGNWHAIAVEFSEGPTIQGVRPDGGQYTIQFDGLLVELYSTDAVEIRDFKHYLIELGSPGWLSDDFFDAEPGEDVFIEGTTDQGLALKTTLVNGSGLYEDKNKNGLLNDDERVDAQKAQGEDKEGIFDEQDYEDFYSDEYVEPNWDLWQNWQDWDADELWADEEWDTADQEEAEEEQEDEQEDGCGGCSTSRSTSHLWPLIGMLVFYRRRRVSLNQEQP